MAKIGDTVRFLNSIGGGVITRIEGKIAYVEEDGFETPMLIKDIVVVLPAGHEPTHKGANIMFDQSAFDKGKEEEKTRKSKPGKQDIESDDLKTTSDNLGPVVETDYGDKLNLTLAFEPSDAKSLIRSKFTAVIVNDSNFYIDFTFLRRADGERGWSLVYKGTIPPNELIDVAVLRHEDLPQYEKIGIQGVAYKEDKIFTLQPVVNVTRKLDLTKFHKFHCFRPGIYFDGPVLEFPLVKEGLANTPIEIDADRLKEALTGDKEFAKELSKKYNTDRNKSENRKPKPENNPHKLLPLIEVDLHIGELLDSTVGMEPKDMLDLQLSTVRKHMEAHSRRKGQKIVFIHGKGEGVLRKAVLDLLKKDYPKAELQDASFREYGFGATLVTIH